MILFILMPHQVSLNGLISFQQDYNNYDPSPFPLSDEFVPIIAPLWADFNFTDSGAVYSRVTSDSDTLDQVVEMITNLNPSLSDYQPSLAVVVTWFEPRLHEFVSGPAVVVLKIIVCLSENYNFIDLTHTGNISSCACY